MKYKIYKVERTDDVVECIVYYEEDYNMEAKEGYRGGIVVIKDGMSIDESMEYIRKNNLGTSQFEISLLKDLGEVMHEVDNKPEAIALFKMEALLM